MAGLAWITKAGKATRLSFQRRYAAERQSVKRDYVNHNLSSANYHQNEKGSINCNVQLIV